MSKSPNRRFIKQFRRLWKSAWLFPVALFAIVLMLTVFKISGTSIGTYNDRLFGEKAYNRSLLSGEPRDIRSDEYLVTTQLTIAQSEAGFPSFNKNIGTGKDMAIIGDAPYLEWSAIFRPQNMAFFIMPIEYAFAFKWWFLLFALISSAYFFVLRMLPGKRLLSALLATGLGFSPFIFWWYQTATLAPIFYSFLIMILGMRIINKEPVNIIKPWSSRMSLVGYIALLAYLIASFILVLYPPFQIPLIIVVAAFLIGYTLQSKDGLKIWSKSIAKIAGIFITSAVIAGLVVGLFILDHSAAIRATQNTVYPGDRHVVAGSEVPVNLLTSYLQPQLKSQIHGQNFYDNQSESSNFLLLLPFILLPGFVLILYEWRKTKRIDWTFLFIQLVGVIFMADLFIAFFQPIYELMLLDKVPAPRLRLGLGVLGFVQIVLLIKVMNGIKMNSKKVLLAGLYTAFCLLILLEAGRSIRNHYPMFIENRTAIIFWAVALITVMFMLLIKRPLLGAIIFAGFGLFATINIQPAYNGLGPLYRSKLSSAVKDVSPPGSRWGVADDAMFENIPIISGRRSITGVQPYPDVGFWRQLGGQSNDYIYNRYAHITFSTDNTIQTKLKLVEVDNFQIKFECDSFTKKNVDFILSEHELSYGCLKERRVVKYPKMTFYLYEVF